MIFFSYLVSNNMFILDLDKYKNQYMLNDYNDICKLIFYFYLKIFVRYHAIINNNIEILKM